MNDYMHGIDVKGPLSNFLPIGIELTKELAESIVGKPIYNCNHIMIGKIYSIDWETKEWIGRIIVDGSIQNVMCESYAKSMEIAMEDTDDESQN